MMQSNITVLFFLGRGLTHMLKKAPAYVILIISNSLQHYVVKVQEVIKRIRSARHHGPAH